RPTVASTSARAPQSDRKPAAVLAGQSGSFMRSCVVLTLPAGSAGSSARTCSWTTAARAPGSPAARAQRARVSGRGDDDGDPIAEFRSAEWAIEMPARRAVRVHLLDVRRNADHL